MPYLKTATYRTPPWIVNSHIETILPYLLRNPRITYSRERIDTPDGDFLDLDWFGEQSAQLAILCHGLEGESGSQYMKGMSHALHNLGWQVLALNFRSCSGEINRKRKMYHHGDTTDLQFLIEGLCLRRSYTKIALVGFSLGGNVILKYLGTQVVPPQVVAGCAISVPCHLASSSQALDQWQNWLYTHRFRHSLRKKLTLKNEQFPGMLPMEKFDACRTWHQFDDTFTTIINEFSSADEYYDQGSAGKFLSGITTPALLINALNDPFLRPPSFPIELAKSHPYLLFETPTKGGHVGFWYPGRGASYAEERVADFLQAALERQFDRFGITQLDTHS